MVYLVGAGVGNKQYITVRGLELIKNCDVLIYDRLLDDSLLEYAREDCKKIYVGKEVNHHAMKQEEINEILVEMAEKYGQVVRLKGGDSFVFGRGGEEAEALSEKGIYYELIPGISSAIAVPELCGIPVTHRGISQDFHVVTGHTAKENTINYQALAKMQGTLVFLMGIHNVGEIADKLIKGGKEPETPTAFLENGGTKKQRVFRTTLSQAKECVKKNQIVAPSILVIGETVNLNFYCPKKKIAVVGTKNFKERLQEHLWEYEMEEIGTMMVKPLAFSFNLHCEYLVFTSRNGVDIFMEYLLKHRIDMRKLAGIKFAVIGKGTFDALAKYGIYADIMPDKYTAEELSKCLADCKGKKLILRAKNGSKDLYKYINDYEDIPVYEIIPQNLCNTNADYVVFGSSSAVRAYCDKFPIVGKVFAIGEITANTLREYGYQPIVAKEYTVEGICNCIRSIAFNENI
ncbi:MAG: uroporphyrinogen-III C-methyltransferase [Lachnospiraceae bacterium]|nr:uroporphyrinogen-III C-methyltransferase [Lachnospiraceae bacterium]